MSKIAIAIVLAACVLGYSIHYGHKFQIVSAGADYVWKLDKTTGDLFYCGFNADKGTVFCLPQD